MKEMWLQTVLQLQTSLPSHTFNTWIKPLSYRHTDNEKFIIEVPNRFYRERLSSTYASLIRAELRKLTKNLTTDVDFVYHEATSYKPNETFKELVTQKAAQPLNLQAHYTFERFVVGSNNQFAFAAAQSVADFPGKHYNPLFIYGGVGLGKTHLLCAIGHAFHHTRPHSRVVYVSSETFTNELIHAIRNQKTDAFRRHYRENCDLLLIDDIQFLSGKERTQEEFFHTFNMLHQQNIQIAVTSDRLPKDILDIDERLRSRFEWGLLCDIQAPDVETRVAILQKKAMEHGLDLSIAVLTELAQRFTTNIRSMEGALTRLCAYASLTKEAIQPELVAKVFANESTNQAALSVEKVLAQVAQHFTVSVDDLKSASRKKNVAVPRQIAMFLARRHCQKSYPELGVMFGGKDHTTVLHACKKIDGLLVNDPFISSHITSIERFLSRG